MVDQPFGIKIRIKDPRNDYAPAEKFDGVLEVVVVDGKEHDMTVIDCEPTGEIGFFFFLVYLFTRFFSSSNFS